MSPCRSVETFSTRLSHVENVVSACMFFLQDVGVALGGDVRGRGARGGLRRPDPRGRRAHGQRVAHRQVHHCDGIQHPGLWAHKDGQT